MKNIRDVSDLLQAKFFYDIAGNGKNTKTNLLNIAKVIFNTYYPQLKKVKIKYISKNEFEDLRNQIKSGHATFGYFCLSDNTIYLNPALHMIFDEMSKSKNPLFPYELFNTIVHEGRHAEQHYNANDLLNNPHSTVRIHLKDTFIALTEKLSDDKLTILQKLYGQTRHLPKDLQEKVHKIMDEVSGKNNESGSLYYNQLVERDARIYAVQALMNICLQNKDVAAVYCIKENLKSEKEHTFDTPSQLIFEKDLEECKLLIEAARIVAEKEKHLKLQEDVQRLEKSISFIDDVLAAKWGQLYLDSQEERKLLENAERITSTYELNKRKHSQEYIDKINGILYENDKKSKRLPTGKELLAIAEGKIPEGMTGKDALDAWDWYKGQKNPTDELFDEFEQDKTSEEISADDDVFDIVKVNLRYLTKILNEPATKELNLLSEDEISETSQLVKKLEEWIDCGYTLKPLSAEEIEQRERQTAEIVANAKSLIGSNNVSSDNGTHLQLPKIPQPKNPSHEIFGLQEFLYNEIFNLDPSALESRFCACIGRSGYTLRDNVKMQKNRTRDLYLSVDDVELVKAQYGYINAMITANEKLGISAHLSNEMQKPPEIFGDYK